MLPAEQRVAAASVGGGRPEGPLRKKGREEEAGEVTRKSAGGRRGGKGGQQKDKCAARSPEEVGPRTGLGGGCAGPKDR